MAPATMLARKRARSSVSTSLADSGPETFEDAFARYNKSGTGELAPDELREFLQDGCDTGDGVCPPRGSEPPIPVTRLLRNGPPVRAAQL